MAPRKTRKKTRRRQVPPTPPTRDGASGDGGRPGGHSIPSRRPGSSWRERVLQEPLAAFALCLLVAASYFPALSGGLVWDDSAFQVWQVQNLSGIWQIWFVPGSLEHEGHYWPILYTTFWLEHKLWGFDPLGYHLVNLLLHSAVTLLLWRFLRRLAVPGAWVAVAIFAVHPLHVESVAWVIGRKDMLAALFYLGAALAYMRFVEDRRWQRYAIALALFTAGLLSKSMLVTLPAALLIWHWWKHGRVTANDVLRVLPLLLLGLFVTVADWSFYKSREVISFDYSLLERALLAARALGFYVGKLAWPTELSVIYPRWEVGTGDWLAWGCALVAVVVAGLLWHYQRQVGRGPLAGLLFFAVILSPTLGFVDYGYMQFSFVADRYQYLAGIGVIAAVVGAVAHGLNRLADARGAGVQVMAVVVLAAVVVVLGTLTWRQAGIYKDTFTFYSHIASHNPQAKAVHYNLGREYRRLGRLDEALAAFRIAEKKDPDNPSAFVGLGLTAEDMGRMEEAEAYYQKALQRKSRFPDALDQLGALRIKQQRYQEALELFQTLIKAQPGRIKAFIGKGISLVGLKRHEDALRSFDRALAVDPTLEEAHTYRASAYIGLGLTAENMGRMEEAEAYYQKALQHNSLFPDALDHLGALRMKQQRYEEAIEFFQTLIEVQPGRVRAYIGKGISLVRLKRHEDALRSFDRALALDPTLKEARTRRAQVLKTLGRSDG